MNVVVAVMGDRTKKNTYEKIILQNFGIDMDVQVGRP
jgi:hypothetical protein